MPFPRPSMLLPVVVFGLAAFRGVRSQISTNATCLSTWQDLYNSRGQSPCLVAAYLGGACNGGQYEVPALDDEQHYIGPTSSLANGCLCSSVYYSLMGACSVCQNATFISWSSWTTSCSSVFVTSFPEDIPQDTAVPGWAYDAIPANGTFNVYQALQDNSLESTATHLQTTNTGTRSSSPSATASAGATGGSNNDNGGTNAGAIAGGVVGGVVGVALIALLGFFLYRHNQRKKDALANRVQANLTGGSFNPPKDDFQYTPVPYTAHAYDGSAPSPPGLAGMGAGGGYGPGATDTSGNLPVMQQKLYDPNDPSTFPTAVSPPPGSMQNQGTGTSATYAPSLPQPQYDAQVLSSNQGQYRGVAEV